MKLQLFKFPLFLLLMTFLSDQRSNLIHRNEFSHHVSPQSSLVCCSFSIRKKDFNFVFFHFLDFLKFFSILFISPFNSSTAYFIWFLLYNFVPLSFTSFLYHLSPLFFLNQSFCFPLKMSEFPEIPLFILQQVFLDYFSSSESSKDVPLTFCSVQLSDMLETVPSVFADAQGKWITLLPRVCPHYWCKTSFLRSNERRHGSLKHEQHVKERRKHLP